MRIFCLIGPTGCGKTSLEGDLKKLLPLTKVISHTTRPRREYEINGRDYYYVSDETFKELVRSDQMIEWAEYNGWMYGVHQDELVEGNDYLLVVEPHGYEQIKQSVGVENVVSIYIESTDKDRLVRALTRETDPNVDEIIRRFISDKEDFKKEELKPKYIVYNREGHYGETLQSIKKFIELEMGIREDAETIR